MNSPKILLLYVHPHPRKSKINKQLLKAVSDLEHVTVRQLYELYPDFQINVESEQQALLEHDLIIFQHPMYWYSAPAILKEWQDTVLEHEFAYGEKGTALTGKHFLSVITAGSEKTSYDPIGRNRYTTEQLLAPFEQTANLCNMLWQAPRILYGSFNIDKDTLNEQCQSYREFLQHYTLEMEQ